MTERSDDLTRRASDDRFRRGREALAAALRALLGAGAPAPLSDADRAAALAAEARAAHRAAADRPWALVRHEWAADDREAVSAVVQAVGALWLTLGFLVARGTRAGRCLTWRCGRRGLGA